MTTDYRIIGIAGTNGSGKDSLGHILAENGWLFIPATEILRQELQRRGLPIERENLRMIGNEWRQQYGSGVLIQKAFKEYKKGNYKGLAIASVRSVGEAEEVHNLGGQIVWVDAEPKIRYQRIYNRGRGAEDQKTFEQFLAEEDIEMNGSDDKTTLNMVGVKSLADIFISNDENDLTHFKTLVEEALKLK